MKILYVDTFAHGINPSNSNFPLVINKIGNVKFFGPSFVSKKTLDEGIVKFIDKHNNFDFMIIGPNTNIFYLYKDINIHLNDFVKFTAFSDNINIIRSFYKDLLENLSNITIKNKVYSMFLIDQYALNKNHIKVLDKYNFYLFSPNENFFPLLKSLPNWATNEEFYKRKANNFDDSWKTYLKTNKHKIISCLHYVTDNEFVLKDLSSRKYDVAVPGIMYAKRKSMKNKIKKSQYKFFNNYFSVFLRLLNRLKFPIYKDFISLNLYNLSFRKSLIDSKYVFTEGGGFNAPVRKFFEITAANCLLLTRKPHSFSDLGYRENIDYVEADEENIFRKLDYFEKNTDEAQKIANNGFNVTYKNHSLSARSSQIKACLLTIMDGTFNGSCWEKGKYKIEIKK
ncbi:glycosyltransferase [Alphaproteobacteria bacterium]|nr:glycosyltransferase [Alphaproteobacteria bacterium]